MTNRIDVDSYKELRVFGRKVIESMGITTAATHMEWFFGPEGLKFSEIACRPPGVCVWDLFCAINDIDLYVMWANAVCHGKVFQNHHVDLLVACWRFALTKMVVLLDIPVLRK